MAGSYRAAGRRPRAVSLVWAIGGLALVAGLGAAVLGAWWALRGAKPDAPAAGQTARVVRDRLIVTITESGEVEAKRSNDIKCEVEGQSTVIWLIEEGSVVKPGDRLVELDAADLQERLTSQRMVFDNTRAAYERARQQYEIQKSTNESLLSAADLKVKFALLDLKKYLGTDLAERLIGGEGRADFPALAADDALGGEALQQKRKLASDIDLAGEELERARVKERWTRTLKEKGYVTGSELEADVLAVKRRQVELDQAGTSRELFLAYEFPKQTEKFYTDWLEAKREYARVEARCASELATAKAELDAKEAAFNLEQARLAKTENQLKKTAITAPQGGMVVYSRESRRWGQEEPLAVGAVVRHQQTLIQLPDLSEMNVRARLHESVVKQVADGAPSFVTIDAWPDRRLTGKVTKIAVMPDRTNYWLNPGLKTYVTDITLDETPGGLKPGMSAQVEVLVDDRPAVLQVPVSSVHVDKGYQVVYVRAPASVEVRRVEVGLSNERVVEIVSGLAEGDQVYLYKPGGAPELKLEEGEEPSAAALARREVPKAEAPTPRTAPSAGGAGGATEGREARQPREGRTPRQPGAMTPEKMEEMRKRLEQATPEERERILKQAREMMEKMKAAPPPEAPASGAGEGPGAAQP